MEVLIRATRMEDTGIGEVYQRIRLILLDNSLIMHTEKQRNTCANAYDEEIYMIRNEDDLQYFEQKMREVLNFFDFEEASFVSVKRLNDNCTEYNVEFRKEFEDDDTQIYNYTLHTSLKPFNSQLRNAISALIEKAASKMTSCIPAKAA